MKRLFILFVLLLALAGSAMAAPAVSTGGWSAWLGEQNHLYLLEPSGTMKVLRAPILDILSIKDGSLYCLSETGRIYAIPLGTGEQPTVYAAEPAEADFAALAPAAPPYVLDGTVLTVRQAGTILLEGTMPDTPLTRECLAAAADDQYVWYVAAGRPNRLMRLDYTSAAATPAALCEAAAAPISMTVTPEAVTIVAEDRSVVVVTLPDAKRTVLPAFSEQTAAAVTVDGKTFRYTQDENGYWVTETAADLAKAIATPSPTPSPTIVPVITAAPTPRITATPKKTAKPTATPRTTDGSITYGDRGTKVKKMQQRLIKLGYPLDKADGKFGEKTLLAVNLFQHAIGYKERGWVSESCLKKLNAGSAPKYDPTLPLQKGDKGAAVLVMQETLFEMGYDPGKIDGKYGDKTVRAVKEFQKANRLKTTGVADKETLSILYGLKTPSTPKPATPPAEPDDDPTSSGGSVPGGSSSETSGSINDGPQPNPGKPDPDPEPEPEPDPEPAPQPEPEPDLEPAPQPPKPASPSDL